MTKKHMGCPAWLGLSDDRSSFVFLPERAKIVRKVFELSIAGFGGYTIAKQFNEKNIPAFGPSSKWDQSTIHNMLRNRATIGEYQAGKHRKKQTAPIDRTPVKNYYPPVIEEGLFDAAQVARQRNLASGRGRKGRFITNLFAGLPTCFYCGNQVKFHSNGQAKSLVCQTVLEGSGCHRFGWSYGDFEKSVFQFLDHCNGDRSFSEQLQNLRIGVENQSDRQIYDARAEISQILKVILLKLTITSAGPSPLNRKPDAIIRRDHPKRYFTVTFSDGSSRTGFPATPPQATPRRIFNSTGLSKALGLSPRQGALTALLAEGTSLTLAAENLGITLATARWHLRDIFRRTNAHSQADLVGLAERTRPPRS
jgi:DNA-binding CsgD family transcriptional regulator